MLNRNAKTLKVYSARITTSKQLYFANLLRISINYSFVISHLLSLAFSPFFALSPYRPIALSPFFAPTLPRHFTSSLFRLLWR